MLSEGETKSVLMPSQDTILVCPMISSYGELVSAPFKHNYNFFYIKIHDITIKNLIRVIMEESKNSTPQRWDNLNYTLLNRYDVADLIFLFKEGLCLIINRLSFNCNKNKPLLNRNIRSSPLCLFDRV